MIYPLSLVVPARDFHVTSTDFQKSQCIINDVPDHG